MAVKFAHKQGDTFEPEVAYAEDGAPYPLTGHQVLSQVRTVYGELVAAMEIKTRDDAAGRVTLRPVSTAPVTGWPLDRLAIDVRLVRPDGAVISTETAEFDLIWSPTAL